MEQRLTLVCLGVNDLERSVKFYEDVFGWKKTAGSNDNIVFMQLNGFLLSLYPRELLAEDATVTADGSGFKGFTLAHNVRSTLEVDDLVAQLVKRGARLVKEPTRVFWGGYSSYIADPDDNLWEIAFNPYLPLDDDGNTIES